MFVSEYVNLYVDYLLNRSIYQQFASFYHGFHSVCASNALIVSTSFTLPGLLHKGRSVVLYFVPCLEKCYKT